MNTPKVSVIIPVYNVEPFLERCLGSVLSQTYANIEIILINDGSTDKSPQICDEYAKKDSRIVVIHKQNGGQSDARNFGLDICKGDYISFVDSDDWIEPTYIEDLLNLIQKENVDIAICELERTRLYKKVQSSQDTKLQLYTPMQAIKRLFLQREISFIAPYCKIYKQSLFENIRFPVGKVHEDEFVSHLIFYKATKIAYTSKILYYYFQRAGSTMGTPHPYELLEAEEEQFDFILNHNMTDLQASQARLICWQILYIYSCEPNKDIKKKLVHYEKYLKLQKNPFIHYFLLKFFCHYPYLYSILRSISPLLIRK